MAEFETVRRTGAGVRTAQIDEGLRAHMNQVYGLMAGAMVITGLAAWAIVGPAFARRRRRRADRDHPGRRARRCSPRR